MPCVLTADKLHKRRDEAFHCAMSDTTLLTKKELAARYQIGERTIDRWIAERRIPVIQMSKRLFRFDPARCDEALRRFEREAVR
jgi:excisionase family DNA binding protein